jgi:hypothetical protein
MYPNLDFWFENKPSGNPGLEAFSIDIEGFGKYFFSKTDHVIGTFCLSTRYIDTVNPKYVKILIARAVWCTYVFSGQRLRQQNRRSWV